MKGIWRLTVRDEFSGAHALRHYEGKCERLHGHNFAVELTVEGPDVDPATGMMVDFKILKNLLKVVLAELDHQDLNNTPPFDSINPSSENLARHIYQCLATLFAANESIRRANVRLKSVTVAEKDAQSATYEVARD